MEQASWPMDSLVDPVEYVPFVILPIDSFQFWVWLVSIIAQGSSVASFLLDIGMICEQPLKLYIYSLYYWALQKIFQFTFGSANNGGEKL